MKIQISTACAAPILLFLAATLTACGSATPDTAKAVVAKQCSNCGTISSVETMTAKGEGTGVGAVAGALVGAVVGHQIGDGKGQDVATVAGAIGGGYAGHEIEKLAKGTTYYHVKVAMDDGGTRSVDVPSLNGMASGSKVKVVGNGLQFVGA